MTVGLNNLSPKEGSTKNRTRVGRGIGSGKGKTAGRGHKGQKSRSGVAIKGFEGGQMPIHRRLPKRGFNNSSRKNFETLNLGRIQSFIDAKKIDPKKEIDLKTLIESGAVSGKKTGIKILSQGEIKDKVTISADKISETALKKLEKAGGKFNEQILAEFIISEKKAAKKNVKPKAKPAAEKADSKDEKKPASKKAEPKKAAAKKAPAKKTTKK